MVLKTDVVAPRSQVGNDLIKQLGVGLSVLLEEADLTVPATKLVGWHVKVAFGEDAELVPHRLKIFGMQASDAAVHLIVNVDRTCLLHLKFYRLKPVTVN